MFRIRKRRPSVVISDKHIGTSMWQASVLEKIGVETEVHTLSKHSHYVNSPAFGSASLFRKIGKRSPEQTGRRLSSGRKWSKLKFALCSFPPSRIEDLERLPQSVRLILNIGHRIHIHLSGERIKEFTEKIKAMPGDSRYKLATMSDYDYHYTRYYTGIEPLRLPVVSMHVPESLRSGPYRPGNRVVLIGPSHNTSKIVGFGDSLERLNQASSDYARVNGLTPFTFDFIKSIYPGDLATPGNLARHPAVLVSPYSAFSISMVELYQMNIPFFVAADELLVDQMEDVRLSPLYQTESAVSLLEAAYPNESKEYQYSPNDNSPEAQLFWMKYMYFNRVENACRWSTPQQLFDKLYSDDLAAIHDSMQSENESLFDEQMKVWALLFGECVSI